MSHIRSRLNRIGLQRRIMLYVTIGLAAMFGTLALLGLGAIDEAVRLVFRERLSTAYTTAGIIGRDLDRTAATVREIGQEFTNPGAPSAEGLVASDLLRRLGAPGPDPFFRISGVWLLDSDGDVVSSAGLPSPGTTPPGVIRALEAAHPEASAVLRAVAVVPGAVSFATILVRMPDAAASIALVHMTSVNSSSDFVPESYGRARGTAARSPATETYHLEVVDHEGITILGVGADEKPGQPSYHFAAIADLMAVGSSAALLHEPGRDVQFEAHVMAVVPLAGTPFYVVLEQAIDVALALPLRLRQQLILATTFGFLVSLTVAWITTRRVVKPTEELTRAAERMAGGDLGSPVSVTAQDEIGELAESLEVMRVRLGAAHEAVEQANRNLEMRVGERTERLGQVLRQTISAQEDERRRLARELHDETAQTIAALSIALDRARDGLHDASPETVAQIGHAREISVQLLDETRRLILGLRPTVLDDMGLVPAIRWYAESHLGDEGIEVAIEEDGPRERLPSHIEVALFRIVQEALTNIAKHAQAGRVEVRLARVEGSLTVTVTDDGRGFDVSRALGQGGPIERVGLLGMQERVRLLGGRLDIRSRDGGGTVVRVEVPSNDEVG